MTTTNEMYDACERHDWLYDFSDDHRVWCSGEHAKAKLLEAAAETPENQAVYDAWRAYMSSGPPWDTPKNPKPARPVEWTLLCKRTERREAAKQLDRASVHCYGPLSE